MTTYVPPSDNMRLRLDAIEKLPTGAIAFFRIGSFYEAFGLHAGRMNDLFHRVLKRPTFGTLTKREGVHCTCVSIYMIHTVIAILQTEGITAIYVAEDGFNLKTVRAWLAE